MSELSSNEIEGGTIENIEKTKSIRIPKDRKRFSNELYPYSLKNSNNLQEVLEFIRARFDVAKEEVNQDLKIFAGKLVELLDSNSEDKEALEELLLLGKQCDSMKPSEFYLQCEGIVQCLNDRRQKLPMGLLNQLHTQMLFILTRCSRLVQFHKEHQLRRDDVKSSFSNEEDKIVRK